MSNRLPILAAEIQREHAAVGEAAARGLQHALAAGDGLLEAKTAVAHGEWASWLAANVPGLSARTAQLYMRLARNRDRLNPQRVAHLTLRAAAALVSKPGAPIATPEPVATLPTMIGRMGDDLAAAKAALERGDARAALEHAQRVRAIGDDVTARSHRLLYEHVCDFLKRWPVGDMPNKAQIALCCGIINAVTEGVDAEELEAARAAFERALFRPEGGR